MVSSVRPTLEFGARAVYEVSGTIVEMDGRWGPAGGALGHIHAGEWAKPIVSTSSSACCLADCGIGNFGSPGGARHEAISSSSMGEAFRWENGDLPLR